MQSTCQCRSVCRVCNEAVVSSLCRGPGCTGHHSTLEVRPHPGTQDQCRAIVVNTRHTRALRNSSVINSYSLLGSGIARAHSCCSEAAGICGRDGLRSQPVRSARERTTRAAHFRCLWPASAPRKFVESLGRRAIMKTLDKLPGESNTSIISSIINSVCPQCGGRMSVFQCDGRCSRNWLTEWEWANQATRRSKSRLPSHTARSMRWDSSR